MQDTNPDPRVEAALRGESLYGDDFTQCEIAAWFAAEVDGYAELDHLDSQTDKYVYHAMDAAYSWPYLPAGRLRVLGLGSAYGSEFRPIAKRIESLTIVEPGSKFWRDEVAGIPAHYVLPNPSGELPFADAEFDVATAFGVLHHIPNVSKVLTELARVIRPGGCLFLREPITSMGDWRYPRRGLTRHERGLTPEFVSGAARRIGCTMTRKRLVGFAPLVSLIGRRRNSEPWNSASFVGIDAWLSRMFERNWTYHRTNFLKRFAPTIGCWVLTKTSTKDVE